MRRVLTADKADTITINAGSADVLWIVIDELRKNVEAALDASGSWFEEAANQATLVGNKLTVPSVTGTTVVSNGGMVISGDGVTIVVQVNSFGGRNVVIGGASGITSGHLTVTVRIPRGVRVTATTCWGDIITNGVLTNANLHTSVGDIRVDDVEGTTVLKTNGGDLVIDNTSGVLNATTSGGNVMARRVTGFAVLNTSGGYIRAHADYPAMLSAGTSGGNITLSGCYFPNTVTASASGGSVYY
jgi:hypothetical protein